MWVGTSTRRASIIYNWNGVVDGLLSSAYTPTQGRPQADYDGPLQDLEAFVLGAPAAVGYRVVGGSQLSARAYRQ